MKMTIKAQSSFEFLLLIGVIFTSVIILIGALYGDIYDLSRKKDFLSVKDLTKTIQNELVLAAQVEDGYHRDFSTPKKINGKQYSIYTTNNSLTISSDKSTFSVRIPIVKGFIINGKNNITKEDNEVLINNG